MTPETQSPMQTGTTPNPLASNTQDFSGSADDVLDNFAEAPLPDDANHSDDGTPIGLGGEKQKQSEPASSTLEADIVNGTKQSGDDLPPHDSAGKSESVQDTGETGSDNTPDPDPEEPQLPDYPLALLQAAGLTDAAAAQASGFKDPESLFAAVKWRSQLLTPGAQPAAKPAGQGLYKRPVQSPATPATPPQSTDVESEGADGSFKLPAEKMDMLDEDLQDVIRDMNDHYQQRYESLQTELKQSSETLATQQGQDEEVQFDEAVQSLGDDWKDVFGNGDGRGLDQAGQSDPVAMTNFNHRTLLFETVQDVRDANAKHGYKPMPLEQEMQLALMQRYPNKYQEIISDNSNSNGKSGRTRGVTASRPTQRNTPPKGQNSRVLSDVSSMLKKRKGYSLDMGQEDELDGEI